MSCHLFYIINIYSFLYKFNQNAKTAIETDVLCETHVLKHKKELCGRSARAQNQLEFRIYCGIC
jgi:hypothetical protein